MVFFDTKQLRFYLRLTIFCTVFGILSLLFIVRYEYVYNKYSAYRENHDTLSYYGLCEYLDMSEQLLDDISTSQPSEILASAKDFSTIGGSAKILLIDIPLKESGKERLNTFFSECEKHLYTLCLKIIDGEIPTESDYKMICSYRDYAAMISSRLSGFYNESYEHLCNELLEASIDTPPSIEKSTDISESTPKIPVLSINNRQAREIAEKYIGKYAPLKMDETSNDIIRFFNGSAFIDILRSGGHILRLSVGRDINKLNIDHSEAIERADKFTAERKITTRNIIGYNIANGCLNIRYNCANSFIDIGIALDNGSVVYYDASEYYMQ